MRGIDVSLLIAVAILTFFGLLMIYDASSFIAYRDFADKYHYLRDQTVWVILGFSALLFFSFFDYHKLNLLAVPILVIAIILLILVFVPGLSVYALGARRWIDTGFFILQPAEFVKLALAIYLSAWFSTKEKGRLIAFGLLLGLVMFLIMLQPDMGTAGIILSEAMVIYFLSGGSLFHFVLGLPVIAAIGILLIKLEPYRAERLTSFLKVGENLQTTSYHVRQILIALGMGGLTGVGLGNSLQKFAYLPENTTDSIFAIIAEELGFIGASLLIILFMFVTWRGFIIASRARDQFGKLLAAGITTFLMAQAMINLGAQTVLLPLTGVPLPFISYGGSAVIVDLCAIGIVLNISKQKT